MKITSVRKLRAYKHLENARFKQYGT